MIPATGSVRRLSIDDVHKMVAAGVLDEDDRVELVQGVLVEMSPIGPEHGGAVAWLTGRSRASAARRGGFASSASRGATCSPT